MRKIIVGIKPSEDKTFSFNLYRSTFESSLASDTNTLLETPPLAYITEADCEISTHCVKDTIAEIDTQIFSAAIQSVPYTVKFRIIRSIQHDVTVRVQRTDNSIDTYLIKFTGNGDIDEVFKNDTLQDTSQTVPKIDLYTVYMHNNTMLNVYRVTLTYYTEVIVVEDSTRPQAGVEYLGPSISYIKPITLIGKFDQDNTSWSGTKIQYLEFACTTPLAETTYYYRVIARDNFGNLSDPSNIGSANIDQELASVSNTLFACDWLEGVAVDDQQWFTTNIDLVANDPDFVASYKNSDLLDKTCEYHHQIKLSDVYTNYIHDVSQISVGIFIPNVWLQRDKYFAARTKAFRVSSATALVSGYTANSNVIMPQDINVPIERLLVLRTEVSDTNDLNFDLPVSANGGQKVAEWVKVDGRYYDLATMDNSHLNVDVFRDPALTYPVDIMTFTANTLTVFDDTVEHGKIYRYDIYTWDDYNTESKVLPIYVTCL